MNNTLLRFASLFKNNKKKSTLVSLLLVFILIIGFNFIVKEKMIGYKIVYNNTEIGIVKNKEDIKTASNQAYEILVNDLGYDPELSIDLTTNIVEDRGLKFINIGDLSEILKENYYQSIKKFKKNALAIEIDEETLVFLENKNDIEEVFENIQRNAVGSEINIDVEINIENENEVVITKIEKNTEIEEYDEELEIGEYNYTLKSINFLEDIKIYNTYAYEEDILNIQKATEVLNRLNEEPSKYKVVEGDVASIIARNNDMTLSELYDLNEGLETNDKLLQIGDELIVMVPEPEVTVVTKETAVYTRIIERGTKYVDNPKANVGINKTIDYGNDGILQVTADITKINGIESEKEITDETVIKESKEAIISLGSKPLPTFVRPLASYSLTSRYGSRWNSTHKGIDMAAPYGDSVRASRDGVVTYAGWKGDYGNLVEIDHGDGTATRYGHNSEILVSVGQKVSQYEVIAKVGSTGYSTGPHVHFEILINGVKTNPFNYLD